VTEATPLPSVAAVVSYLDHSAGWMRLPMWSRDGHEVDVPEDASAGRVALVLDWIAEAEGRGAADVAASVRAFAEAGTVFPPGPQDGSEDLSDDGTLLCGVAQAIGAERQVGRDSGAGEPSDEALARAAVEAVAANTELHADLLESAWGVIANAGWDDCAKTTGWQEAAERWRDDYHRWLDLHLRPGGYQTWEELAVGITRERDALVAEVAELRRALRDAAADAEPVIVGSEEEARDA
jgi:hypothetical protein